MFCRKWCPKLSCANSLPSALAWIHRNATQNLLEKKYSFKANVLLLQTAILKYPVFLLKDNNEGKMFFFYFFFFKGSRVKVNNLKGIVGQQNYRISVCIPARRSFMLTACARLYACCAFSVVYWFPQRHDTGTSASFPFIPCCKQMHVHSPRRGSPVSWAATSLSQDLCCGGHGRVSSHKWISPHISALH